MSHKPIWYVKQIPPQFCDMAIADFSQFPAQDANMGKSGENKNHEQRNTTIRFVPSGHWFSYLMHGVAREANLNCRWMFDIDSNEDVQFAEYGPNQHYNWHVDTFPLAEGGIDRKISVVCLLTDPSEFEGGDLEIKLYSEFKAPLTKGMVIAFPSFLQHRVTPVISGLRRTAVVWMTGPRFR